MNVNSKAKFNFKQPSGTSSSPKSSSSNAAGFNLHPQQLQGGGTPNRHLSVAVPKSLGSNTWSSPNSPTSTAVFSQNSSPLGLASSGSKPLNSSSMATTGTSKRSYQQMQEISQSEYLQNSSSSSATAFHQSSKKLNSNSSGHDQQQQRAFARPSTAAPQRLSFPASESGSAAGMSSSGQVFDHQMQPPQGNPLLLLFNSSHQIQQEALSSIFACHADLEKNLKQKASLSRELGDVKREADKLKTHVSVLESDLAFQKKWNLVVDVRHKGMISARDSILHGLQITRAKSQTYQKEIDDLALWVERVQKECAQQRQDSSQLVTANQALKQELEAAKETLAEQRKTIHELNDVITQRSSALGSQIDQLSKINTARFDSTDAAADQSKACLEEKLSALVARNEELEKVVVALERRVVESVVAEGEKQLNKASDDWQAQFLANVEKHESLVTELKESYGRELLNKTQVIDEKSASIDDLSAKNLAMAKRVDDMTLQVAELRREAEAADKIHREAIHEHQKKMAISAKELHASEKDVSNLNADLEREKNEIIQLKSAIDERNLKINALEDSNKQAKADLAQMKIDLQVSLNQAQELKLENSALKAQDARAVSELIESGWEKVSTALSSKESKEADGVREQLSGMQGKLESATTEIHTLKSREAELSESVTALQSGTKEKERHIQELTTKISTLGQQLAKEREAAKEKAQADFTSAAALKEKLIQKDQDLENVKYKSESEIKALEDQKAKLAKELAQAKEVISKSLAEGHALKMSRSLSDIEAQATGDAHVVSAPTRRSALTGASDVKKEALGRAMAGAKGKRGPAATSSKAKGGDSKVMQRKINEKMEPKNSFDIFEAPF